MIFSYTDPPESDEDAEALFLHNNTSSSANPPQNVVKDNRRDVLMSKHEQTTQIEILKWAEKHSISTDDPAWLLVDMLGYSIEMTETIPGKIQAAAQRAVDSISVQRKEETEAFADNASNLLDSMLSDMIQKIANESDRITDLRLKQKILQNSLFVSGFALITSAICVAFGFAAANVALPWYGLPSNSVVGHFLKIIFGLPVGFLIPPLFLSWLLLFIRNIIKK